MRSVRDNNVSNALSRKRVWDQRLYIENANRQEKNALRRFILRHSTLQRVPDLIQMMRQ